VGELAADVGAASVHQRLVPAAGRRRASNRLYGRDRADLDRHASHEIAAFLAGFAG
jgi:hypothetical protein